MNVFKKLKKESKESKLNSFNDEFKSKSFYDTYISLYDTANIVKYVNNAISIIFCYCFFSLAFNELNTYLSIGLSIACCVMIEVIKTKVINASSLSYFKRSYTTLSVTASISIFFLFLSVYTSLIGSERFNEKTNTSVNEIEQSNKNKRLSILSSYTDRITQARQDAESFFDANKVIYQGGYRVDYRSKKQYNKLKDEVLRLEELKDKDLMKFDDTSKADILKAQSEKTNISMYFMCISIINELLLLACIWFSKYFSFVAFKESVQDYHSNTHEHVYTSSNNDEDTMQIGNQKTDVLEQISNKIGFDINSTLGITDLNYLRKYPNIVNALLDGYTPYKIIKNGIGKQTTTYKCNDILKAITQHENT